MSKSTNYQTESSEITSYRTNRQAEAQKPFTLNKHIGTTMYRVNVHFSEACEETLEEKILRLIKNELQSLSGRAIIKPLQAGWLPERGSV